MKQAMSVSSHLHRGMTSAQKPPQKCGLSKTIPLRFERNASPHIAVVDSFTPPPQGISHGQMVKKILQQTLPDAQILEYSVSQDTSPKGGRFYNIPQALQAVLKDVQKGIPIKAINLSMGDMISLSELKEKTQISLEKTAYPISPPKLDSQDLGSQRIKQEPNLENKKISAQKAQIMTTLKTWITQNPHSAISTLENIPAPEWLKGLETLDSLYKTHNIPTFVAAGNQGNGFLNLYLLSQGAKGVGALNESNTPWEGSGNNPFVTHWAPGTFQIKQDNNTLSSVGPGTSFATPLALGKTFKSKSENATS
ncbi:MAG: S8/S53 family peptidase [Cyanobacteria bacterium]|nr:S8/S53 family peptidase [Cyanobacteriota bacterium]